MKKFIKQRLREEMIDGQEMNQAMETICNKMTVDSYEEAWHLVQAALKGYSDAESTMIMQRIHVPLENLKHEQIKISQEVANTRMSGDSMVDEADTYWHQIQTTICELGPDFQ